MGVKDLWQLLSPIGRRVSIETLEGKTLAIDASIWITQFIKAMRDEEGKMMKNAHLIGTIRRVLKLLFHRIRPLFVFDGATPALKLRTVQARRKGHEKQEESKRVAAQRLLRARLKEFAVKQSKVSTAAHEGTETEQSSTFVSSFKRSAGQGSKAETSMSSSTFDLKAGANDGDVKDETDDVEWVDGYENLKEKALDADGGEVRGEDGEGEDEMQWQLPEDCGDLSAEALAALPSHLRKSLIEEARRKQRMQSRAHYLPVAGNPALYSQTQLSNFLNSSKLNRKFIDAHQSTQSALVGTGIAAEGKKKYQFISRSSMLREPAAPSTFPSEDVATATAPRNGSVLVAEATAVSGSSAYSNLAAASSSSFSDGIGRTVLVDDRDEEEEEEEGEDFWMPHVVYDGDVKAEETAVLAPSSKTTVLKNATAMFTLQLEQQEVEEEEEERTLTLAIAESLRGHTIRRNKDSLGSETAMEGTSGSIEEEEQEEEQEEEEEEVAWESGSNSSNNGNDSDQSDGEEGGSCCNNEGGSDIAVGNGWMAAEAWFEEAETAEDTATELLLQEMLDPFGKAGSSHADLNLKSTVSSQQDADRNEHTGILIPMNSSNRSNHSNNNNNNNNNINKSNDYDYTNNNHERSNVMSSEVLDRAVHTASSMADWAGRAVRNALKEHTRNAQQHQQQYQQQHKPNELSQSQSQLSQEPGAHHHRLLVSPSAPLATMQLANAAAQSPPPTPHALPVPLEATREDAEQHTTSSAAMYDFTSMSAEERTIETRDARRKFNAAMRDTETLTEEMRCEVIELLQALNLPYIIAPYEAEAQCAVLEQLGLVDGVVTEDSDALLFGANTVYKNIFNDKKYVEVYLAEDARREMGLHREDLVALAYFLGSDYCEGVAGVGIVNAVEIIHAFPMHAKAKKVDNEDDVPEPVSGLKSASSAASAEAGSGPLTGLRKFKEWLHGFDLEQELRFSATSSADTSHADDEALIAFTQKHRSGRGRWSVPGSFPDPLVARAYLHPQADRSPDSFAWTVPDVHSIRAFCRERLGWTEPQMDMAIDPVLRRYAERSNQPRIDAHFLTYHGDTRFAKIASDRLREAVVQITGKRTNLALGGGGGGGSATTNDATSKRVKAKKEKQT